MVYRVPVTVARGDLACGEPHLQEDSLVGFWAVAPVIGARVQESPPLVRSSLPLSFFMMAEWQLFALNITSSMVRGGVREVENGGEDFLIFSLAFYGLSHGPDFGLGPAHVS